MAYGTVKVDTITFDNGGADQSVTASGIYRAITSGVTITGTISGVVLIGTTTVSGATVTGTSVRGITVQGASGTFTSLTGTTTTGTTANFASGVFTTQVSGLTVTGTVAAFTSGNFVTLSGATATFTSGVIASGTAAAPSLSIASDPNTGLYSPASDTLAFVEGGVEAMRINSSGNVGIGRSTLYNRFSVTGPQATDALLGAAVGPVFALNNTNNADTIGLQTALTIARDGKSTVSYGNHVNFNIGRYSQVGTAAQTQLTIRMTNGNQNDPDTDVMTLLANGYVGIGTTSPTTLLDVNADTVRVRTDRTPVSASATGAAGEICWDSNYIYVCTATNTWKRTAIATW
jgi:hypothetical protein